VEKDKNAQLSFLLATLAPAIRNHCSAKVSYNTKLTNNRKVEFKKRILTDFLQNDYFIERLVLC